MTALNGVEATGETGEDTNSNAARAGNTGGGWHRNNPVLVKAEWGRLETSVGSQDRRLSFGLQAPIGDKPNLRRYVTVPFRPRQGSEMPSTDPEEIARRFAEMAANQNRAIFNVTYENLIARCESPIEKIMAAALIYNLRFIWHECDPASFFLPRIDYRWPNEVGYSAEWNGDDMDGTYLFSQAAVGKYRVDFLIRCKYLKHKTGEIAVDFYAIECDGHDFHERTSHQATRDRQRDRWMTSQGIVVLRFTGTEICRDIDGCMESLFNVMGQVPHWAQGGDE